MLRNAQRWLLALLPMIAACESQLVEEKGTYVVLTHPPDRTPCGGTLAYLDAYAKYASVHLGIDIAHLEANPVIYHWIDYDVVGDVANVIDSGCQTDSIRGDILCANPITTYEIVHVLALTFSRNPNIFQAEGLAQTLEADLGGRFTRLTATSNYTPDDFIAVLTEKSANTSSRLYVLSVSFVSHLIFHHGMSQYTDFYGAVGFCSGVSNIREAFLDVYGVSLDEMLEEFLATSRAEQCATGVHPIIPFECSAPEVEKESERVWGAAGTLRCEDQEVIGDADPVSGEILRNWTIDLETDGMYRIRGPITPRYYRLQLGSCSGCPFEQRIKLSNRTPIKDVHLDAGRYFIQLSWSATDDFDYTVSVEY